MRSAALDVLVVALALLGAGCATSPFAPAPPEHRVHGMVVDAETGQAVPVELVPRQGVSVRFFRDEQGERRLPMVRAEDGDRFDVRLPYRETRIVVDDPRRRHHAHEETLRVPPGGLEHVISLRPTHRVLLKGRAIDARTGGPARLGKTSAWLSGDDGAGAVVVDPDDRGHFEAYVPRAVLQFTYVNPVVLAVAPTLDLSGVEGEVVERTVLFRAVSPPLDPDRLTGNRSGSQSRTRPR